MNKLSKVVLICNIIPFFKPKILIKVIKDNIEKATNDIKKGSEGNEKAGNTQFANAKAVKATGPAKPIKEETHPARKPIGLPITSEIKIYSPPDFLIAHASSA